MSGILLVEDIESDASLIQRAFRLAGIAGEIQRIADGADALGYFQSLAAENIATKVPSVLLLDLNLPGVRGLDILVWLQGSNVFEKMLRIVLSQLDDLETIKNAYAAGAHSYLTKPLHQSEVNDLIASFPGYFLSSAKPASIRPDPLKRKPSTGIPTDPPH
jgi:DNA-binding response OmpR family regulator